MDGVEAWRSSCSAMGSRVRRSWTWRPWRCRRRRCGGGLGAAHGGDDAEERRARGSLGRRSTSLPQCLAKDHGVEVVGEAEADTARSWLWCGGGVRATSRGRRTPGPRSPMVALLPAWSRGASSTERSSTPVSWARSRSKLGVGVVVGSARSQGLRGVAEARARRVAATAVRCSAKRGSAAPGEVGVATASRVEVVVTAVGELTAGRDAATARSTSRAWPAAARGRLGGEAEL